MLARRLASSNSIQIEVSMRIILHGVFFAACRVSFPRQFALPDARPEESGNALHLPQTDNLFQRRIHGCRICLRLQNPGGFRKEVFIQHKIRASHVYTLPFGRRLRLADSLLTCPT